MRPSRVPDQYQLARHGIDPATPGCHASGAASPRTPVGTALPTRLFIASLIVRAATGVIMADPARRAKLVRDLEQDFVPDYDAQNMPQATSGRPMPSNTSPSGSAGSSRAWRGLPPRSSQCCRRADPPPSPWRQAFSLRHRRFGHHVFERLAGVLGTTGAKLTVTMRINSAIAATFGAVAKNAVTGVGAPS